MYLLLGIILALSIQVHDALEYTHNSAEADESLYLTADHNISTCITFNGTSSGDAYVNINFVHHFGTHTTVKLFGIDIGCDEADSAKLYPVPLTSADTNAYLNQVRICDVTSVDTYGSLQVCNLTCTSSQNITGIRLVRRPKGGVSVGSWKLCEVTENPCPTPEWWHISSQKSCYKIQGLHRMEWRDADIYCTDIHNGSHLLDLQTSAEQEAVRQVTMDHYASDLNHLWTSGTRPSGSTNVDEFYWGSGEFVATQSWTSWEAGQPDDIHQDCLAITPSPGASPDEWGWRDAECNSAFSSICELFIGI